MVSTTTTLAPPSLPSIPGGMNLGTISIVTGPACPPRTTQVLPYSVRGNFPQASLPVTKIEGRKGDYFQLGKDLQTSWIPLLTKETRNHLERIREQLARPLAANGWPGDESSISPGMSFRDFLTPYDWAQIRNHARLLRALSGKPLLPYSARHEVSVHEVIAAFHDLGSYPAMLDFVFRHPEVSFFSFLEAFVKVGESAAAQARWLAFRIAAGLEAELKRLTKEFLANIEEYGQGRRNFIDLQSFPPLKFPARVLKITPVNFTQLTELFAEFNPQELSVIEDAVSDQLGQGVMGGVFPVIDREWFNFCFVAAGLDRGFFTVELFREALRKLPWRRERVSSCLEGLGMRL